ncbi:MAG: hypothetical protein NC222_06755 [Staphylococcus sp.]|nr:hypothetical protein [Staphylococcus sp.]
MKITQTSRNWFNKLTNNGTTMGEFTHIISICCPDDDSIKPINENHLIVKMWDVDKVLENNFRKYEPPSDVDCIEPVTQVSSWMFDNKSMDLNILIHCDAGVSRSSAIALGILWNISGRFFRKIEEIEDYFIADYIRIRKEFCASLINTEYDSNFLKWYVEGKNLMRGVKPNQAILKEYRNIFNCFPW